MRDPEVVEIIFVRGSSEPPEECDETPIPGPDLSANLTIEDDDDSEAERSSEIQCWEDDHTDQGSHSRPSSVKTVTPRSSMENMQTVRNTRAGVKRTASFDDPTDELEHLEIDESEIMEEEQNSIQSRLAQKWRMSYSLGSRLLGVGHSTASSPRTSAKVSILAHPLVGCHR